MSGKLICIYGINNLGKSTQAKKLVEYFKAKGIDAEYLKYPLYDLAPSGPILNAYLREGNPLGLSAREAQLLFVINRTQFDSELRKKLESGKIVVAEDYTGTGIAWGMGCSVSREFLEKINSHLLKEDVAFLFEGERFMHGKEKNHTHEGNDSLMDAVMESHKQLGRDSGWITINAGESKEKVHGSIVEQVKDFI
jgi:thymidylate kinase